MKERVCCGSLSPYYIYIYMMSREKAEGLKEHRDVSELTTTDQADCPLC